MPLALGWEVTGLNFGILGGASGFGAATARLFAAEGAQVVIADLNEKDGERIAATDSDRIIFQKANVTSQEAWQRLVQAAEQKFGHLDIVVNNAGTSYANKPTLEVTEQDFDSTMEVNVKSIFWSAKVCIPAMLKSGKGGAFVNVASIGATRPRPGLVWYAASKASVANVSPLSFPKSPLMKLASLNRSPVAAREAGCSS